MKRRKWIVALGVGVCALGIVSSVCVTFLEKNRTVERFLIQRIAASTGSEFSAEHVTVGFFSIYLQNVKIALTTHFFSLKVRDIKVGISPWRFIQSRGAIVRSVGEIVLVSPELEVYRINGEAGGPPAQALPLNGHDVLSAFRDFPIDHFTIRKGVVRIVGSGGGGFIAGEDLSGQP